MRVAIVHSEDNRAAPRLNARLAEVEATGIDPLRAVADDQHSVRTVGAGRTVDERPDELEAHQCQVLRFVNDGRSVRRREPYAHVVTRPEDHVGKVDGSPRGHLAIPLVREIPGLNTERFAERHPTAGTPNSEVIVQVAQATALEDRRFTSSSAYRRA